MARPLPILPMQKLSLIIPIPVTFPILLMAIFSVFSIVTFLCGIHKSKKMKRHAEAASLQLGEKKFISKLQGSLSSKALLMAKMISWRKMQDDEEEELVDDNEAMWKRTIIMGERCRPLDFSGKISYDAKGNLLPTSPKSQSKK